MALKRRGKAGIWWYLFKFAGRRIHESSKSTSKTVAREAEKARRRQLEESFNGIEKRKMPPTFERAAKEWLERRASIADSTRETYGHALKHLSAAFGKSLVCDIAAAGIAAHQKAREKEGAAGATVNKEFTVLASILADHGLWAVIRRDTQRLDENESAGRALLPDEEARLLQAASQIGVKQGHWSPIYTVTVLGLNTGLRHSEVRKLRWAEVDMGKRVLIVGKSKSDSSTGRPIPIIPPAWAAMSMWEARFPKRNLSDYVFPACENGNINPSRPISHWRHGARLANWPDSPDCGIMICVTPALPRCSKTECQWQRWPKFSDGPLHRDSDGEALRPYPPGRAAPSP